MTGATVRVAIDANETLALQSGWPNQIAGRRCRYRQTKKEEL